MRVFRGFDNLPKFNNSVATVGSFDGLHAGHLALLDSVKEIASRVGGESVVLTFEIHPRVVLGRSEGLRLLTSMEEKIILLERYGVDNLIIIPFDREFSRLSPSEFVIQYLVEKLNVSAVVVGYNHHLGRGSEGGYSDLKELSVEYNFELCRVAEWRDDKSDNVSSTVVRGLIARGDVERASELLTRPYMIVGQSDSDGRVWVNDALKQIPAEGIYRAQVGAAEVEVHVDENGVLWYEDEPTQRVVIEIIAKKR